MFITKDSANCGYPKFPKDNSERNSPFFVIEYYYLFIHTLSHLKYLRQKLIKKILKYLDAVR